MLVSKNKLIPLRCFVLIEGYSKEYLSQLVQRKRLKAQKIGRNYFTTLQWFEDYLHYYARADKAQEIKKNLYKILQFSERGCLEEEIPEKKINLNIEKKEPTENNLAGSFVFQNIKSKINIQLFAKYMLSAILIVAVFLFLLNNYFNKKVISTTPGRVAGASEESTSSKMDKGELQDSYEIINNTLYRVSNTVSSSGTEMYMMEKVK
jgi:hypothetical protein